MIDPVTLAVVRGSLEQIADEMDLHLIHAAHKRLWIATPYFVPPEPVLIACEPPIAPASASSRIEIDRAT